MAISAIASGTQTATLDTEHTLSTDTSNQTYVFVVDAAAMAVGDVLELYIYTKCLSGGTERLAYSIQYTDAQAEPMKYSVPVPADISFKATLKQTAGTGRAFPWKVLAL